jgi:hypothetical protein
MAIIDAYMIQCSGWQLGAVTAFIMGGCQTTRGTVTSLRSSIISEATRTQIFLDEIWEQSQLDDADPKWGKEHGSESPQETKFPWRNEYGYS